MRTGKSKPLGRYHETKESRQRSEMRGQHVVTHQVDDRNLLGAGESSRSYSTRAPSNLAQTINLSTKKLSAILTTAQDRAEMRIDWR